VRTIGLRIILRNIFSNWTGYLITILVGFFLAPFVLHHLGNTGYGVWTLVLSLTGYFGLLDLGIRSSVGRFVARHVALCDADKVNRTVSTAMTILSCGGLLALLATAVIELNFDRFKVGADLQGTAKAALLVAGIQIACSLPLGVFGAVLVALERFDIMTGVTIAGAVTRAALIVVFLKSGHSLIAMASIALVVGVAEYTAMGISAKALYRPLAISRRFVDRAAGKELMNFGMYRFVWTIANQLIFYTDSLVIGMFLGASDITFYAIAGSLITYGRNIVSLATDPLYPMATRMDSKNDREGLRQLQILGTRIGLLVGLPLCLGLVFLGKQFISLWMGPQYAWSASILIVLTIPQFSSMSQYVSALVLAGMARHKILAYVALGEGIANLALSIVLVRRIGAIGVAWGTVIPHLISTTVVIPFYTLRTLKLSVRTYVIQGFLRPILCAIPVAALCYGFSQYVETPTWLTFGSEVAVVGVVLAITGYFICLTTEQQASISGKLHGLMRREAAVIDGA
jgi:O-antigen/teichoic acid export membrane protein